jgi:hypothetical protein
MSSFALWDFHSYSRQRHPSLQALSRRQNIDCKFGGRLGGLVTSLMSQVAILPRSIINYSPEIKGERS